VKVDAPVKVTKTESKVLTEGTGEAITKDDLVSIQAIIVNGTDGKQAHSTWETGPVGLDLGAQDLFPDPSRASCRARRSAHGCSSRPPRPTSFGEQGNPDLAMKADDPVVFVVDVVGATKVLCGGQGRPVAPAGLPTVTMNEGKPATITVPKGAAPHETLSSSRSSPAPARR
jgi:peptidylprolyl isomerase